MLYLQYRLHNSWENPYKWTPGGSNTLEFSPKMTPNIDIMLKYSQFGPLDITK